MDIEKALLTEAEHIAANLDRGALTIKARLDDIERQKAHAEAELETAHRALQRGVNFKPRVGRDFQCPSCWIRHEARASIRPIPSTDNSDILRCNRCDADWVIPYKR